MQSSDEGKSACVRGQEKLLLVESWLGSLAVFDYGTVGLARHSSGPSQHNPEDGDGVVERGGCGMRLGRFKEYIYIYIYSNSPRFLLVLCRRYLGVEVEG